MSSLASGAGELHVPGGCAAWNRGADFVQHLAPALAPEQGAVPDTVNRTIKLRLLAQPTVPVSTAIRVFYAGRGLAWERA